MSNYVGRGLNLFTYKTIFYVSEVIKFKKSELNSKEAKSNTENLFN